MHIGHTVIESLSGRGLGISGILKGDNTIIEGDLNLNFSQNKIWGEVPRRDPLTNYFSFFLSPKADKCGMEFSEMQAKYFEMFGMFLVVEQMNDSSRFKSWVGYGGASDHVPILSQTGNEDRKPPTSFKFNHSWLNEVTIDSRDLMIRTWKPY